MALRKRNNKLRKQKLTYLQKLLIFAVPLILLQGLVLYTQKNKSSPVDFKDAMDEAVAGNESIDESQQAEIRIHLALNDYRITNAKYPDDLSELVPDYFDQVPIDPRTAESFKYRAENDGETFRLGEENVAVQAGNRSGGEESDMALDDEEALLASLNDFEESLFIYDSTGKRDPFRSYDFDKQNDRKLGKNPLQRFDYPEFRISAILLDSGEPKAIIEDGNGKGHTVRVGEKIGLYGGKIHEIKEDKITVIETTIDFTGEKNTKLIDIFLPAKANDYGSLSREDSIGRSFK